MTLPAPASPRMLTVPEVGRRLHVSCEKIRGWIASGELRAIDVRACWGKGKRPRWRISEADLQAFLLSRSAAPAPRVQRRRRQDAAIVEYV
jgi:excisionase family DNA binding protein